MKVMDLDSDVRAIILWSKLFTDRPSNKRFRTLKRKVVNFYRLRENELNLNLYLHLMEIMDEAKEPTDANR